MRDATYTIQREKATITFQYSTDPDKRDDDLLAVWTLLEIVKMEIEMMRLGGEEWHRRNAP